jgi:uncharacterized protein involved in cysteine biosynthesis
MLERSLCVVVVLTWTSVLVFYHDGTTTRRIRAAVFLAIVNAPVTLRDWRIEDRTTREQGISMQSAECSINPLLTDRERKFVAFCLQRGTPIKALVSMFVSAVGTSIVMATSAFQWQSPWLLALDHLALYLFMAVLLLLAGGVMSSATEVIRKYEAFIAELVERQHMGEQRD